MFFYLSKILAFIISPIVWISALLVWACVTKKEGRRKRLLITACCMLYILSNPFIVDEGFRAWEPVNADHDLLPRKYQGAIVLGGVGEVDLRLKKMSFG